MEMRRIIKGVTLEGKITNKKGNIENSRGVETEIRLRQRNRIGHAS